MIPNCNDRCSASASAGDDFDIAIVTDIAHCDEDAAGEGYRIGIPLAKNRVGCTIENFNMSCTARACAGN